MVLSVNEEALALLTRIMNRRTLPDHVVVADFVFGMSVYEPGSVSELTAQSFERNWGNCQKLSQLNTAFRLWVTMCIFFSVEQLYL